MEKGDIVLITFPFTDLSGNKNRPALVLAENRLDVTVAFISTQMKWHEKTDVTINPSEKNGLKKHSLIRLSKLATIDRDLILGKLGNVDIETIKEINYNLKRILKLE